ncbi:MAG: alpha-L-rhamnosidase C-terminal domain-containing protein [Kiritimatiellae bacterium]|nr:alpha-L-rhamnosidase C-terminal domain-containing protein [Kiritimatiellia bacterium]
MLENITALPPTGLLCDLLEFPERTRLTNPCPNFGWVVRDAAPNARATAYRILVATRADLLRRETGDLWDSGRVASPANRRRFAASLNVPYDGRPLRSNRTYHWQVRTWNHRGEISPWSMPQRFRTGRLATTAVTAGYLPEQHCFTPLEVVAVAPGHTFIDFGKAAFGTIEIVLTCRKAGTVEVHLGEVLSGPHALNREPGGSRRYRMVPVRVAAGTRTYRVALPKDARNTGPSAVRIPARLGVVMPFRYAEIVGRHRLPRPDEVRQIALTYPFNDRAASFGSSCQVLNDVWDLCHHTIKATSFAGLYVDGDRERIPYEADAYINQLGHYGCDREFSLARRTHEYLITHPNWPTEWLMFSVLLAWADYEYTGDLRSLARFYPDLQAKTLTALARPDGLISVAEHPPTAELLADLHYTLETPIRDIVDWPPCERDGYELVAVNTVVNALHYRALTCMRHIALVLGKRNDARRYAARRARVRAAILSKLVDKSRRLFVDGLGSVHSSLHASLFPLAFGLVPAAMRPDVLAFIRSRGMACSVYGAQFLLEGLYEAGEADYALSLLTARTERSWSHMIYEVGSTIALEAWDNRFKPNQDWNHPWGAAPANIIPRYLMGVRPLEPGFGRILIHPQPGSLDHATMTVPTIRGPVCVGFRQEPGRAFHMEVDLPANTVARVLLPRLRAGKKAVRFDDRAVRAATAGRCLAIDPVGSGRHRFEVS